MSRTRKDAPAWVKANRNLGTSKEELHHRHEDAGKPIYRHQYALNEDGKRVVEEYKSTRVVGYWVTKPVYDRKGELYYYQRVFADNIMDARAQGPSWRIQPIHETVTLKRYKTVRVLTGHAPTECTAHDPLKKNESSYRVTLTRLCAPVPDYGDLYYNRPAGVDDKRNYHSGNRAKELHVLHAAAKEYNSGHDLDEDYLEEANTRPRRHSGWW